MPSTKILLIDSYDSFTFNLASLCRKSIPDCDVHIVKNDDLTISELVPHLSSFSAIVVGPGPGSPDNPQDIGLIKHLWKLADGYTLPIFGVCLGLQSLAIEFGAHLKRLPVVKHGQISRINHQGTEIFEGVGRIDAVRYHSLHVQLLNGGKIEELAWADDGTENGKVVMAVKHKIKPFWAVQYHPESARTSGGGKDVFQNFWRLARVWNSSRRIKPWGSSQSRRFPEPWPRLQVGGSPAPRSTITISVKSTVVNLPEFTLPDICELLGVHHERSPFVVLDSAAKPGRFSIIGVLMPSSTHITYNLRDRFVRLTVDNHSRIESLETCDIWTWVASFMQPRRAQNGSPDIPFWGGLVGYLSYELGVDSLSIHHGRRMKGKRHPDLNLVFVERSIVLDAVTGSVHVQSLLPNDGQWIAEVVAALQEATACTNTSTQPVTQVLPAVTLPDQALYKSRINIAKERLFSGDSYELCLTAPTHVSLLRPPKTNNQSFSWTLYKNLRKKNPAPHSAYLRLHPTTLLASSPERFLSFSRPPHPVCQLRPIKGTVRKAPGVTRAVAEERLINSPKEVAENLMIVDLIRHDLHGVLGEDVVVKQFCGVEEYETVWQLVSVVEGRLPRSLHDPEVEWHLGWDILRKSLPPGSMTGAPKKRSVEILQTLEDTERGIYSGVFGYWCVSGGGDWSVTIRSCFKYDDGSEPDHSDPKEDWTIGAGGAITALSCPDAEWDEMVVKLQSVLRTFGVRL